MQLHWHARQAITPTREPFAWRAGIAQWLDERFGGLTWATYTTQELLLEEPPVINECPDPRRNDATAIGLLARSRIVG